MMKRYGSVGLLRNSWTRLAILVLSCLTWQRVAAQGEGGWPVAWGANDCGQLGDEYRTNIRVLPVLSLMKQAVALTAGRYHTLALRSDSSVWAWGHNEFGQLGNGTTMHCSTPVRVAGLNGVVAIAAGGYHSLALKSDGTVWAWGYNEFGQLGDGTTIHRSTPVRVSGLSGVVLIAAGGYHSLALKSDGTVWAWGHNVFGQLGDGTTMHRSTPVRVSGLSDVVAIAGGWYYSLALKSHGTVSAWGNNWWGQLGDGTATDRLTPVTVSGLSMVLAIAADGDHSLALKSDGTVWAWGNNSYGQLGDGTWTSRLSPVAVSGLSGVVAIAAGGLSYSPALPPPPPQEMSEAGRSLALKSDGTVWAWGNNEYGQLGDGTTTHRGVPVAVPGLSGVAGIAAGSAHSVALNSDGTVWAWGYNRYGQLGDGSFRLCDRRPTVRPVPDLSRVSAVAAGASHSLALKPDGTVWAWGSNWSGQLGDGTNTDRSEVVATSGPSGVVAIAAGGAHSLALKSEDTVWAWGNNWYGQLGDGTTSNRSTPGAVSGLNGVIAIAAGGWHSIALKSDGTVWAWGRNGDGQLGDGTTSNRPTPVAVSGLNGVIAIAAGGAHSLALKSDGTVWAWGRNGDGQLGDGTTNNRSTPVAVSGLDGVIAIAAGGAHSLALKSDGTVWAWGDNYYGQLGDGTTMLRSTPVRVSGLSGVVAIAAGGAHSLALKSDGTVWAWGNNEYGQLGDRSYSDRRTPGPVMELWGVATIASAGNHCLAVSATRTATVSVPTRKAWPGLTGVLSADLFSVNDAMPGRLLEFLLDGTSVGSAKTNAAGRAEVPVTIPLDTTVGFHPVDVQFAGATDLLPCDGRGWLFVTDEESFREPTTLWAPDRTGAIRELVTLRGYLRRSRDNAWLDGKTVRFFVDGSEVGTGITGATGTSGRADLNWVVSEGPAFRTIRVQFDGDSEYLGSSATATLTVPPVDTVINPSDLSGQPGAVVQLFATLRVAGTGAPIAGRSIEFRLDDEMVGSAITDASGVAVVDAKVPDGATRRTIYAKFAGDNVYASSWGMATLTVTPANTALFTLNRSGTVTEPVVFRAYLKRLTDNGWVVGRTVKFRVDGTLVGAGVTNADGRADYTWTVTPGPKTRTITAEFAGDPNYNPSSGSAVLAVDVWTTKMATFDRTARITDQTELKARLVRSDNVPLYGFTINFYVDDTFIIARPTNTQGYASYPYYTVPDGGGAGVRTIRAEWIGNAGYAPIGRTASLTVLRAIPYIYVQSKSVPRGDIANLYAYVRRLYDYQKQVGKVVTFTIDGTAVQSLTTDGNGIARYYHWANESVGTHTIRCEFSGDEWLDPGYGEALLTVY